MPKGTAYVCQNCGESYAKWQGQCTACGEWNTLVETIKAEKKSSKHSRGSHLSLPVNQQIIIPFSRVEPLSGSKQRFSTGIGELDRVLGGGMVPGAVMLIGGEPGIGKSTLLTQVVVNLILQMPHTATQSSGRTETVSATTQSSQPILYVCGEENPSQISLRINRILENRTQINSKKKASSESGFSGDLLLFVTSTDVEEIISVMHDRKPQLVIVDSIQTTTTEDLTGAAGSVGQLREVSDRLTSAAKQLHVPLFLVGHVTKEGTIAGPKVLEHIVDSVIEISGERTGQLRIVRAIKNRFGATDEVGVFQIEEFGLREIANPSELFLEHKKSSVPGSAVVGVLEGTRPLLVEVQALVVSSQLAMPRRVGRGIELSRIQVLSAVLQKHARLPLGSTDIFVNAAGGFSLKEPAIDLGLSVAIASSLKNVPVPANTVFIGEVGLLGEIRTVPYLDKRIKEAQRMGYDTVISRKTHATMAEVLSQFGLKQ